MRVTSIIIILLISISSVIIIEALLDKPSSAVELHNSWKLYAPDGEFIQDLSSRFRLNLKEYGNLPSGLYTVIMEFDLEEDISYPSLVIPQQPDQGFQVKINDGIYAVVGDIKHGNANIWKDVGIISLGDIFRAGSYTLEINIYSSYELVMALNSYICDTSKHPIKFIIITFLSRYLGLFMSGITFITGLMFISLALISKEKYNLHIILGISFLIWTIYFSDYYTVEFMLGSYLTFKKIIGIAYIAAFLLNALVVLSVLQGKLIKKYVVIFTTLQVVFAILLILPGDIHVFWRNYNTISNICYLFFIPLIFHPRLFKSRGNNLNLILIGVLVASVYSLRYVYYETNGKPYQLIGHVGVFLYIMLICAYFMKDYLDNHNLLLKMTVRADHYFNKAVMDPLTLVNNRNIIEYVDFKRSSFVFIICDLDDFKDINDKYGHDTGDKVLQNFANIIKGLIRDRDYIIRLGGDEFLILLKDCPYERAKLILKKMWELFDNDELLSCSGGAIIKESDESYNSAYKRADRNLYDIKKNKKGTFNFSV